MLKKKGTSGEDGFGSLNDEDTDQYSEADAIGEAFDDDLDEEDLDDDELGEDEDDDDLADDYEEEEYDEDEDELDAETDAADDEE